ncbi:hypothetical protein AB0F96_40720 [Streptomyces sp. NPDC023998]|uniref:hypothetical protein n=1 Tax=Streptomyces sp. NPDC023998 TaxID=3154597 RepID=UPI0033E32557
MAVKFSGGGSGPMLSGVKDGRTLSLSWPKPLPKPTLDGNVATYPEILAGVDLQLKAEVESFSQLLVVKTAEAAQNPELAQLHGRHIDDHPRPGLADRHGDDLPGVHRPQLGLG